MKPALKLNINEQTRLMLALFCYWLVIFILNAAGPHWDEYLSLTQMLQEATVLTTTQAIAAFIVIIFLVPMFLERKKWVLLLISLVLLSIAMSGLIILVRYYYLEPTYPERYIKYIEKIGDLSVWERLYSLTYIKKTIFMRMPLFLSPAFVLMAYQFFTRQENLLRLIQQKKTAELDALKNQLNPHFLFNTLNNIYALTIKKSDEAPLAIEKLSAILDYVVYRCDASFVRLDDEISLVNNFIALEKIRYGERLEFELNNHVDKSVNIAPLILLTLLENACKHSMREELGRAKVIVNLRMNGNDLHIAVSNTKPNSGIAKPTHTPSVGLANLTKQLDLLFAGEYDYQVNDSADVYVAKLIIPTTAMNANTELNIKPKLVT